MTGYGKAEAMLDNGKLTIEIRTLNGKSADVNIKSSLLPREKELEVRSRIATRLQRGTVDVFVTWEAAADASCEKINLDKARSRIAQAGILAKEMGAEGDINVKSAILSGVLKMPDLIETSRQGAVTDENWPEASAAIDKCLDLVDDYRAKEGTILYKDVSSRVAKILSLYDGVEKCEPKRLEAIRARIKKAAEDNAVKMDKERFEQEMIFYLEKLDINEEKVRLRQHCKYFMDTIDAEACPGKKLGFIIQEMGREINTTGSKANDAEMQKLVVQMKDELEKIREQSMNIL